MRRSRRAARRLRPKRRATTDVAPPSKRHARTALRSSGLLELEPPAQIHAQVPDDRRRHICDVVVRPERAEPLRQPPLDVRADLAVLREPPAYRRPRRLGATLAAQPLPDAPP